MSHLSTLVGFYEFVHCVCIIRTSTRSCTSSFVSVLSTLKSFSGSSTAALTYVHVHVRYVCTHNIIQLIHMKLRKTHSICKLHVCCQRRRKEKTSGMVKLRVPWKNRINYSLIDVL